MRQFASSRSRASAHAAAISSRRLGSALTLRKVSMDPIIARHDSANASFGITSGAQTECERAKPSHSGTPVLGTDSPHTSTLSVSAGGSAFAAGPRGAAALGRGAAAALGAGASDRGLGGSARGEGVHADALASSESTNNLCAEIMRTRAYGIEIPGVPTSAGTMLHNVSKRLSLLLPCVTSMLLLGALPGCAARLGDGNYGVHATTMKVAHSRAQRVCSDYTVVDSASSSGGGTAAITTDVTSSYTTRSYNGYEYTTQTTTPTTVHVPLMSSVFLTIRCPNGRRSGG